MSRAILRFVHSDDLPPLLRAGPHPSRSRSTRALQRAAASGALVVVRPGVFVEADEWERLDLTQRYRLRVTAAVPSLSSRLVVSHESALALHGGSLLVPWPPEVHFTDPERTRAQAWPGVVKHAGPLPSCQVQSAGGASVTSPARTCVDLALGSPFEVAVACLDESLRRSSVTRQQLLQLLDERPRARGRASAARAIAFASALSDSGGESWCRCRLLELGAPCPTQQVEFRDARGLIGRVDFFFEREGVVLEFDGDQKYLNRRYAKGRSSSHVLLDERKRERRLLALPQVRDVVRVEWRDLVDPWRLRSLLVAARVPVR